MTTLPGIGLSVIQPVDFGNAGKLPSQAAIGGSPPPPTPSLRLASDVALRKMFNPIMSLWSRPVNTIDQV